MATAEDLVTQALRLVGQVDVEELAPTPAQLKIGLDALSMMIASWETKSFNIANVSLTGAVTVGSAVITGLSTTAKLAPGLNVTGTGVSGRILTIDSTTQITLTQAATVAGTATSLAFTAMPFEPKFERAVMALLAMDIALLMQEPDVPPFVREMAADGWTTLEANFIRPAAVSFDNGLLFTSVRRSGVVPFSG